MNVLISGAGIAGPTLAFWLERYGHRPTLVERAPGVRTGGYAIDFWGAGFDIAEKMGLTSELDRRGYNIQEVRSVDRSGRRRASFPTSSVARALGGRFVTVPRSELSSLIFDRITGKIETRFGDSITKIEEADGHVRASFHSGYVRNFDLVIGADGLHSGVRTLAFGPELKFERHLGYLVAAFETDGYRPRDELAYVLHTDVGWQVARFAMREDRTLFLFVFADDPENPAIPQELSAQKDLLHERFASGEWECPRILEALDRTTELYFDRVSQIQMGTSPGCWHRGRVALVGDAASCVSFLAGQGAALAMVAAYLLAGELHAAGGDYTRAFERYEARFGPFVASKQRAALRFAGAFVPRSALSLFLRDRIMNAMSIPWIAKFAMGRGLVDKIELPDYADNDTSPPIKR